MRRRPPANTTLHIHAEALAGTSPDAHNVLPTLEEWQRAFEEDDAEQRECEAIGLEEPTDEQEISVRGIVQGEALEDGLAAAALEPVWLDAGAQAPAADRPAAGRRSPD